MHGHSRGIITEHIKQYLTRKGCVQMSWKKETWYPCCSLVRGGGGSSILLSKSFSSQILVIWVYCWGVLSWWHFFCQQVCLWLSFLINNLFHLFVSNHCPCWNCFDIVSQFFQIFVFSFVLKNCEIVYVYPVPC